MLGKSLGSLHSKGILNTNVIHPEEKPSDISIKSEQCNEDLFTALNYSKSFYFDIRDGRIIHVRQFTSNFNHLYDINNQRKSENFPPVLFFIHGVGGSWNIWDSQIQYFMHQGYNIVALDLLGHGLSTKPREDRSYEFMELAVDVLFIFDTFCKRRNVLIGHSYGTSFCVLLSKERRNLVSKMILISGGGPTVLVPDKCSAFCLPSPIFFLTHPILLKMFYRMAFHEKTSNAVKQNSNMFSISPHVLKAIMQGQNWVESDEQYHMDLSIPALLIYGRGDRFVSLADEIWMNETMYGSTLKVIDHAGHMVMMETPEEVNQSIHDFLNLDASTCIDKNEPNDDRRNQINGSVPSASNSLCGDRDGYFHGSVANNGSPTRVHSEASLRSNIRTSQTSLRGSKNKRKTMY